MRILWLGPSFTDDALHRHLAVNQAANRWSRGLLGGLTRAGAEVFVCTHRHEQYWPLGMLWPGREPEFDPAYPAHCLHYLNVPGARGTTLRWSYRHGVLQACRKFRPDCLMSYNLYPWNVSGAAEASRLLGIPWVPVVLDEDDPEPDAWGSFQSRSRQARGLVFLSHWGFVNYPGGAVRLHLDGGCDAWRGVAPLRGKPDPVLLYAGKFDRGYGGLELLGEIIRAIRTPHCRILLCGKCDAGLVRRHIGIDPRVEHLGFLGESELDAAHQLAAVFLNPRPPEVMANRMIYPSKVTNYLAYGKPVVSSWTDGLAPVYRELLEVPAANQAVAYAERVDQIFAWSYEKRLYSYERAKAWILDGHLWTQQAQRLHDWLQGVISARAA